MKGDLEASTFQKRPAYRYIRKSDHVPALRTDGKSARMARVKLFSPSGSWTWFISEYDPKTRLAYGLVIGHERELGSFSMVELVDLRVPPFGLPIERDLHWSPRPLSEC